MQQLDDGRVQSIKLGNETLVGQVTFPNDF